MTKNKEMFIKEINELLEAGVIDLKAESREFFAELSDIKAPHVKLTDKGKAILKIFQENPDNEFTSKDLSEMLYVSGKSISGSIRPLENNNLIKKVGNKPVSYKITDLGTEITIEE